VISVELRYIAFANIRLYVTPLAPSQKHKTGDGVHHVDSTNKIIHIFNVQLYQPHSLDCSGLWSGVA